MCDSLPLAVLPAQRLSFAVFDKGCVGRPGSKVTTYSVSLVPWPSESMRPVFAASDQKWGCRRRGNEATTQSCGQNKLNYPLLSSPLSLPSPFLPPPLPPFPSLLHPLSLIDHYEAPPSWQGQLNLNMTYHILQDNGTYALSV